jgi:hypothetical protein
MPKDIPQPTTPVFPIESMFAPFTANMDEKAKIEALLTYNTQAIKGLTKDQPSEKLTRTGYKSWVLFSPKATSFWIYNLNQATTDTGVFDYQKMYSAALVDFSTDEITILTVGVDAMKKAHAPQTDYEKYSQKLTLDINLPLNELIKIQNTVDDWKTQLNGLEIKI